MTPTLGYDVFICDPIPQNVAETVPNGDRYMWSPQSTTLIHGDNDAVLVDPPFTTGQVRAIFTSLMDTVIIGSQPECLRTDSGRK